MTMRGAAWGVRLAVLVCAGGLTLAAPAQPDGPTGVAERVQALTRATAWTLSRTIPLKFRAHHPQGLVRIGAHFYLSSVQVSVPTRRFASETGGYDRDTGSGTGHLFKIDEHGALVTDLKLGEGSVYHPGGIDSDGRHVWVPVAEYRPNGRSIVYRVEPDAMTATEMFRWNDHIGAVAYAGDSGTLHGVSWGSRRLYRWPVAGDGRRPPADVPADSRRSANPSHYVDYQDCKYAGRQRMVCTGVAELRAAADGPVFRLGGLELLDLADQRPLHQVPILLWTSRGLDLTHNATFFEATETGLRGYFAPEDDQTTIYVYETTLR